MIRWLRVNQRPLIVTLKVGHRLQCPSILIVVGNAIAEPSEEWTNVRRVKVIQVGLIIVTFLGHPDTKSESVLRILYGHQNDAADKEVLVVDGTRITCSLDALAAFGFRNPEVRIGPAI